jgi:hypothetical protein
MAVYLSSVPRVFAYLIMTLYQTHTRTYTHTHTHTRTHAQKNISLRLMELDAKHAFYWCVHEQARSFHPNGSQSVKGERIHQRKGGGFNIFTNCQRNL